MNKTAITTLLLALTGAAHADTQLVDRSDVAPKRRHLRMGVELATIFTAGHEWYWRDHGKPNQVDWQLPVGSRAAGIKLSSFSGGWRFDGNPYDINAIGHPCFGMMTTFLARENGYTLGESFLISTLASGGWETFMELREYGSLNDMMMTSPAGVPLGETAYEIVHHVRETDVEVRGGVGVENGAAFADLAARADLDRVPTTGSGTFSAGRHVGVAVDMPTDAQGMRSVDAGAKTTLAGMYRNTDDSQLVVALSSEFDYRRQSQREEREWDLRTMIAFGPSIDYRVRAAGYTVAVGADAYLDFGLTKSEAFAGWRADHPMAVLRNVLENREQPYYYAAGASVDPRVSVARGGFVSGLRLDGTLFSSLDGGDRDQEMITTHLHMTDTDAHAEAWLGYQHDDISVLVDGRVHRRAGSANDADAQTAERTAMLSVGYRL
jgi:hypothetical protein